ncbi:hypothetical protein NEHOM01_1808 [Nematocida homosporus]|uniref:uncharacterized protein n=1 Tax=Nematocida homosporus TaxID=1912981 RepID=UPI002220FAA9|nr:uncharacterized protein NEHOM01_1808 [Nematocida homosporus]KAI5186942.1 hypothetical protein NEHOM01_1808 [Nematocida homosporus]
MRCMLLSPILIILTTMFNLVVSSDLQALNNTNSYYALPTGNWDIPSLARFISMIFVPSAEDASKTLPNLQLHIHSKKELYKNHEVELFCVYIRNPSVRLSCSRLNALTNNTADMDALRRLEGFLDTIELRHLAIYDLSIDLSINWWEIFSNLLGSSQIDSIDIEEIMPQLLSKTGPTVFIDIGHTVENAGKLSQRKIGSITIKVITSIAILTFLNLQLHLCSTDVNIIFCLDFDHLYGLGRLMNKEALVDYPRVRKTRAPSYSRQILIHFLCDALSPNAYIQPRHRELKDPQGDSLGTARPLLGALLNLRTINYHVQVCFHSLYKHQRKFEKAEEHKPSADVDDSDDSGPANSNNTRSKDKNKNKNKNKNNKKGKSKHKNKDKNKNKDTNPIAPLEYLRALAKLQRMRWTDFILTYDPVKWKSDKGPVTLTEDHFLLLTETLETLSSLEIPTQCNNFNDFEIEKFQPNPLIGYQANCLNTIKLHIKECTLPFVFQLLHILMANNRLSVNLDYPVTPIDFSLLIPYIKAIPAGKIDIAISDIGSYLSKNNDKKQMLARINEISQIPGFSYWADSRTVCHLDVLKFARLLAYANNEYYDVYHPKSNAGSYKPTKVYFKAPLDHYTQFIIQFKPTEISQAMVDMIVQCFRYAAKARSDVKETVETVETMVLIKSMDFRSSLAEKFFLMLIDLLVSVHYRPSIIHWFDSLVEPHLVEMVVKKLYKLGFRPKDALPDYSSTNSMTIDIRVCVPATSRILQHTLVRFNQVRVDSLPYVQSPAKSISTIMIAPSNFTQIEWIEMPPFPEAQSA